MIKKKEIIKQCFGKVLKTIGLFALTSSIFVAGCKVAQPQYEYNLPTQKQIKDRLHKIYEDESEIYLMHENPYRKPYKKDGPIMVNMLFEVSDFQKLFFEDCIQEINSVFDVINPNYKFEIDFAPKKENLNNPYDIDVELSTSSSQPPYLNPLKIGNTTTLSSDRDSSIDGLEIYQTTIRLYYTVLDNFNILTNVFKHEFLHTLGFDDAYLNPNATQNTIMQNSTDSAMVHFSEYDVATLDALYRSTDNSKTEDEINQFIQNYSKTNTHTPNHVLAKQIYNKIKDVNLEDFKISMRENLSDNNKILSVVENLSSLENFDVNFGKSFFQFVPANKYCNLFIANYNHAQISENGLKCSIYSHWTFNKDNISTVQLEIINENGVVYAPKINFAFIKLEDFVFALRINTKTGDVSITPKIFEETNLTAEQFFQKQYEKKNSKTQTLQSSPTTTRSL